MRAFRRSRRTCRHIASESNFLRAPENDMLSTLMLTIATFEGAGRLPIVHRKGPESS
jgi:hypothetical protein